MCGQHETLGYAVSKTYHAQRLEQYIFWKEPTRHLGDPLHIFHTVREELQELALYVSAVMVVHYAGLS